MGVVSVWLEQQGRNHIMESLVGFVKDFDLKLFLVLANHLNKRH